MIPRRQKAELREQRPIQRSTDGEEIKFEMKTFEFSKVRPLASGRDLGRIIRNKSPEALCGTSHKYFINSSDSRSELKRMDKLVKLHTSLWNTLNQSKSPSNCYSKGNNSW